MASLSTAGLAAMAIMLLALVKSSTASDYDSTSSSADEDTIVFQTPAPPVASRRCYVCGPRAEQPHNSRRPPTCDSFTEPGGLVEDCDRGYNYCALIITFNPYIESRLCVSQHDVNCTTRVCNTTKETVIKCTCQGDICNGYVKYPPKVDDAVSAVLASMYWPRKERQAKPDPTPHTVNRMTLSPNTEIKKDSPPDAVMMTSTNKNLEIAVTTADLTTTLSFSPTEPSRTVIKNKTNVDHVYHPEKETTDLMSDDPHGNTHNAAAPGKTTTNHIPHGTPFDYDEETEDDEEGSGRSADVEQRSGKRQHSGEDKPAEADKRQATGATTTTDVPSTAKTIQPFRYILLCFLAVLNLH